MTRVVVRILLLSAYAFLPAIATAQFYVDDIDDFHGASGKNCTSTHQSVSAPGWEWNCDPGSGTHCSATSTDICAQSELETSKTLDGQAREMDVSWNYSQTSGTEYGGAIFHATTNSSANGNLDTSDTAFSWGGWFYYTDLSHINALEFDLNQVLDNGDGTTDTIIYAAQCDFSKNGGTWEFANGWKITSNITCPKANWTTNTWHHVVISAHRGPHSKGSDTVTYDSVEFDGTVTATTGTNSYNGADTLNWSPVGLLLQNVQLDTNFTANGSMTSYADLMTTNSPESLNVVGKIDDASGWSQIGGTASSTLTQNVSSPSLDGGSAEFKLTSANAYAQAIWQNDLVANDSANEFALDLYAYLTDPSAPQALAFVMTQTAGGIQYPFLFNCDFKNQKVWEVWDGGTQSWHNTSAPCDPFPADTWVHLTFDAQRTSNEQLQYNWLAVNDQRYTINQTWNHASGTSEDVLGVQVVLGTDSAGDLYNLWIDDMSLNEQ